MRSIFEYLMSSVDSKFVFLVKFQKVDLEPMHRIKKTESKGLRRLISCFMRYTFNII